MSYIVQSVPGSVGHPELCRRPCIYFAAGQCRNSADCNFCSSSRSSRVTQWSDVGQPAPASPVFTLVGRPILFMFREKTHGQSQEQHSHIQGTCWGLGDEKYDITPRS